MTIVRGGVLHCAVLLLAAACGGERRNQGADSAIALRTELAVFAAISTRDGMQKIKSAYERNYPVDLVITYGSSGDLAQQIIAAPQADAFFSADDLAMARLDSAKLVAADSKRDVISNQLVLIEPLDSATAFTFPFATTQMADTAYKRLSLGNVATVPVGRYAKAWLEKLGAWGAASKRVVPAADARAVLAAVEAGTVQAGIVYRTDMLRSDRVRIVYLVPVEEGPAISYKAAAIAGRPNEGLAREFVDYLVSPVGRQIFEVTGFLLPQPAVPPP